MSPSDEPGGRVVSELARRTSRSMIWTAGGTIADALLQLAVLVILARLLRPADFGLVGAAVVVMNLSLVLGRVGLGPAIIRAVSLDRKTVTTAFTLSLALGCTLGLTLVAGATVIERAFRIEGLGPVVRLMALALPLGASCLVSESLLRRDLRFRTIVTIEVATQAFAYLAVGIPMALRGHGAWALAAAHVVQAAGRVVVLWAVRPHPVGLWIHRDRAWPLLSDGVQLTVAAVGAVVARQGDQMVVGRSLGATALGLYSRAYQLMMVPAHILGRGLEEVLFPALVSIQEDRSRLRAAYRRAAGLAATIVLPASVVACAVAPELVATVLGPQWAELVVPFQILTLGMYFRTSFRLTQSVAKATGAISESAVRHVVFGVLVVVGAGIGQWFGLVGVAIAGVLVLAVHFLTMTQLSLRAVGMAWSELLAAHRPGFLGVGTMLVIVAPLSIVVRAQDVAPPMALALCLLAAAAGYGALLLLRAGTLVEEWRWIARAAFAGFPRATWPAADAERRIIGPATASNSTTELRGPRPQCVNE